MSSNDLDPPAPHRTAVNPVWLSLLLIGPIGLSIRSLVSGLILLGFGLAAFFVERRTRRPARSYLRLLLFSALLFSFFVIDVASWKGDWVLGLIAWLGVSCLTAIWTVYYERTEPRF